MLCDWWIHLSILRVIGWCNCPIADILLKMNSQTLTIIKLKKNSTESWVKTMLLHPPTSFKGIEMVIIEIISRWMGICLISSSKQHVKQSLLYGSIQSISEIWRPFTVSLSRRICEVWLMKLPILGAKMGRHPNFLASMRGIVFVIEIVKLEPVKIEVIKGLLYLNVLD